MSSDIRHKKVRIGAVSSSCDDDSRTFYIPDNKYNFDIKWFSWGDYVSNQRGEHFFVYRDCSQPYNGVVGLMIHTVKSNNRIESGDLLWVVKKGIVDDWNKPDVSLVIIQLDREEKLKELCETNK